MNHNQQPAVISRRAFARLAVAAGLALTGCASTPTEAPTSSPTSLSPTPETLPNKRGEALQYMFDEEAQVVHWGTELLSKMRGEAMPLQDADQNVRAVAIEDGRHSKDARHQATTDSVGAMLGAEHNTLKDEVTLSLMVFMSDAKTGDARPENYLSVTWEVVDAALRQRIKANATMSGELLDVIQASCATRNRDVPSQPSQGLILTSASVSAAHVPEDQAAGYDGTTQEIGIDPTGGLDDVYSSEEIVTAGGTASSMRRETPAADLQQFNELVGHFVSHLPTAQRAITAAIG